MPKTQQDPVLQVSRLGFPWMTLDPFLFCVHHDDRYPRGNEQMGPATSLGGRQLGNDFEVKDGFRMYHGEVVPGFPQHPHRGFETVTVVRTGLLDHSDSMGAVARYGGGDLQWLTAGKGILHAEMFPLVHTDRDNPLELFQIWLNLPARNKFAEPHFSMLWSETIPRLTVDGAHLTLYQGRYGDVVPPVAPPASWASEPGAELAIWSIRLEAGASFEIPAASPGLNRMLYFFRGERLHIGTRAIAPYHGVQLHSDRPATLVAGDEVEVLILQGRPIGEPVAQYGPFVMNTRQEIEQAFADYRKTGFGGWPWRESGPVHARSEGRFARRADGRTERPG
jgi:redox-sensitive bicupin YhaK (pirin superfamily)